MKYFKGLSVSLLMVLMLTRAALSAEDSNEQFVRTGTISYSKKYVLAEDFSHIVFKIRNHNPRTMSQLFGWVYRTPVDKEENSKSSKKMILVNNPHKGGLLIKGGPHRPGKEAHWRFVLDRNMIGAKKKDLFTLRVSPKGVFFRRMEPPAPKDPEKKKK